MSTPIGLWKKWEGQVVNGKFPLRQFLGGSDQSAVFLTELGGAGAQRAAIKLIPAEPQSAVPVPATSPQTPSADDQVSRWAAAEKLSHPHLLRLFDHGRCQIDDTPVLFVVMEYAEENLAEIIPVRALSAGEATEMLLPTAEALAYLHRSGLVHGRIRPSNIMAADNQLKVSTDAICRSGEPCAANLRTPYDAPEIAITGRTSAADMWSLGMTLVAVLTQKEATSQITAPVPSTIRQPPREIIERCLQLDPQQRWTAKEVLKRLQPASAPSAAPAHVDKAAGASAHISEHSSKRWLIIPIIAAALLLLALAVKYMGNQPPIPAAENQTGNHPAAEAPPPQSPAPFSAHGSANGSSSPNKSLAGTVRQQVPADVSPGALNTITGRVKVRVQVSVDESGNVTQAKFISAGPSQYFASRSMAAARSWKFNPPQRNGQPAPSEWTLLFEFARKSTQVVPTQTKP